MLERAFPSLNQADVAAIEARCATQAFPSGQTIIHEGAVVESVLMITAGTARVMRNFLDNLTAEFTGPLGPGDLLGEMSFLDGIGASARIVADGEVKALVLTRAVIDDMMAQDPTFAGRFYHSILITLCARLRRTNMRVLPPGDA